MTDLSVEGEENPPIDEFEVGRFWQGVLNRALEGGHHEHDSQGHHDSVAKVGDGEVQAHIAGQDEEEGLQKDVEQVVDDAALKGEHHGGRGEVARGDPEGKRPLSQISQFAFLLTLGR